MPNITIKALGTSQANLPQPTLEMQLLLQRLIQVLLRKTVNSTFIMRKLIKYIDYSPYLRIKMHHARLSSAVLLFLEIPETEKRAKEV